MLKIVKVKMISGKKAQNFKMMNFQFYKQENKYLSKKIGYNNQLDRVQLSGKQ